MKSYANVISKHFYEPALITPARHAAFCHLLNARLASGDNVEMPSQKARRGDEDDDEPKTVASEPKQVASTVIIPVHGTLVAHPEDIAMSECGCAMEDLNEMIDAAEAEPAVERVIYDFRTPGGVVTMIPETGRKIRFSRKNTIAFTNSECCSGGLWLASQCRRFYSTPSSRVGSVGVYTLCLDMTKALEKEGVQMHAISAGKYKLLGAYFRPMKADERAILQASVDKIYAQFKVAMETYRVVDDEHFGNGLVFDGEEAQEIGFTDGMVESLDDILDGMVD